MCISAIAGVAGLAGSLIQGRSADRAASAQTAAARDQLGLQSQIYEEQTQNFQPFLQGGQNALAAYMSELGLGQRPQGYAGMSLSPGANFALQQGRDQIQGGAAVNGGLNSGATMKAMEDYRFGLASQDRDTQLNRLAGLAGMGQSAAGLQGAAGTNYATGAGGAYANIGNANAARSTGIGNALIGGLNTGIEAYQYGQQFRPASGNALMTQGVGAQY